MNRAELMQHMARGGYRIHKGLTAPEPPTVNDTEKALIAGHVRRTVPHGQTEGFDDTPANSTGIGGDCSNCGIEDVRLYSYTTKDEMQTVDVCYWCLRTLP